MPNKKPGQMFSKEELYPWYAEWKNMPEFTMENRRPRFQLLVNFVCSEDMIAFGEMIGRKICPSKVSKLTKSIWYPAKEVQKFVNLRYVEDRGES